MTTTWKLAIAGAVVAGLTVYMACVGASASWQYYLTADECLARGNTLEGARLRVSGRIAPGSLRVAADRRKVEFSFQGAAGRLAAVCQVTPPDNLAEAMEVVVEGRLEQGVLRGDKLLTRCASKYKAQTPSAAAGGPAPARRPEGRG